MKVRSQVESKHHNESAFAFRYRRSNRVFLLGNLEAVAPAHRNTCRKWPVQPPGLFSCPFLSPLTQHHPSAQFDYDMALFSKRLTCFYCGRRSSHLARGPVRKFHCEHCEADNYLDQVRCCDERLNFGISTDNRSGVFSEWRNYRSTGSRHQPRYTRPWRIESVLQVS